MEAEAAPVLLQLVCEAEEQAAVVAASCLRNLALASEHKPALADLGVIEACVALLAAEQPAGRVMGACKVILSLTSGPRAELPLEEQAESTKAVGSAGMMARALGAGMAPRLVALLPVPAQRDSAIRVLRAVASCDEHLPALVSCGLVPAIVALLEEPLPTVADFRTTLDKHQAEEIVEGAKETDGLLRLILLWCTMHPECVGAVVHDDDVMLRLAKVYLASEGDRQHSVRCIMVKGGKAAVAAARSAAAAQLGIITAEPDVTTTADGRSEGPPSKLRASNPGRATEPH